MAQPVTVAEAKLFLRVEHEAEDGLIQTLVEAAQARVHEATLEADGVRTVSLRVVWSDVARSGDGRRTWAVVRLRAVTAGVAA